jgi:hypothetical protein
MAWFRNHYRCPSCQRTWTDEWSAICDDDCPQCGTRHISPEASDDLTEIVEVSGDGSCVVKRSPASAEHQPDYVEIGRFLTREAAAAIADGHEVAATSAGRRLRPATSRQAVALEVVVARLRDARDQARVADCPATLRKICSALKSAEGARRHMTRRLGEGR